MRACLEASVHQTRKSVRSVAIEHCTGANAARRMGATDLGGKAAAFYVKHVNVVMSGKEAMGIGTGLRSCTPSTPSRTSVIRRPHANSTAAASSGNALMPMRNRQNRYQSRPHLQPAAACPRQPAAGSTWFHRVRTPLACGGALSKSKGKFLLKRSRRSMRGRKNRAGCGMCARRHHMRRTASSHWVIGS